MSKFLRDVFLFFIFLLLIDRSFFIFLQNHRPVDYKYFLESKQSFFSKKQKIDLLIIGDSHIADAVDPKVLKNYNNTISFNLGIYHASPFEYYYITLKALAHLEESPKTVLIGTNPIMFNRPITKGKYTPLIIDDFFTSLQMSLDANEGIDASLFFKSVSEKHLAKPSIKQFFGERYTPTREVNSVYHGFLQFNNQKPNLAWSDFEPDINNSEKINSEQVEYFEKTIRFLLEKKIEIILVNPPIWSEKFEIKSKTSNFQSFERILNSIRLKYNIPVINEKNQMLKDQLFKRDFLDTEHLNNLGAVKFTKELGEFLNPHQKKMLQELLPKQ